MSLTKKQKISLVDESVKKLKENETAVFVSFNGVLVEDFKKLKKILEILDKESFNFYLMQKKKILDENLVQETLPPRLLIKATNSILLN